jgi:hypothetical protein
MPRQTEAGTTAAAGQRLAAARAWRRDEDGEKRENAQVHRQRVDGDAMEIDGHGQGEGQFDDERDKEQLAEAEVGRMAREELPGDAVAGGGFEMAGDEAQGDAELGDLGR